MHFADNLGNFIARRGLYCVWVPAIEGQSTPLVARWIDSEVKTSDQPENETSSSQKKARRRCPGTNSQAA